MLVINITSKLFFFLIDRIRFKIFGIFFISIALYHQAKTQFFWIIVIDEIQTQLSYLITTKFNKLGESYNSSDKKNLPILVNHITQGLTKFIKLEKKKQKKKKGKVETSSIISNKSGINKR